VAVVHCMGGKGRTGTVIACYLVYAGIFTDTMAALQHFGEKRSSISKGVVQAAQIRYIIVTYHILMCYARYTRYFGDLIQRKVSPNFKQILVLKSVELSKLPMWSSSCKPMIEIYSAHTYPKKLLFTSENDVRYLCDQGVTNNLY
jgi:phosphatidylinositol-3,4,5-trisphosphate 3-phosphatase/dual-specificity protein phosphatase PTEN